MSQWLFEDSRTTSSSSRLNQSAGSGVFGSSGSSAPGMSRHNSVWKVRTWSRSKGSIDRIAMPYWPGKAPKPKASPGPSVAPSLSRSNPEGRPVFTGATKTWG